MKAPHTRERVSEETPKLGWFHRYPARFPAEVLGEMFAGVHRRLGRRPSVVLDPFAGTGSTLSFARQLSIPSVGVEFTPLGRLIAQVRLDPPRDLKNALRVAENLARAQITRTTHRFPRDLRSWIGPTNALALAHFLAVIKNQSDYRLRRWLLLAVSSALRPSSVWLSGSIKPQIDPNRGVSPIAEHLVRAARALKRDCELEFAGPAVASAKIYAADACKLPFDDRTFDCVITSPPYWTMYDYFDVHRLSYLAFGWPMKSDSQIGRSGGIERDGVGFVPPHSMAGWYREIFKGEDTIDGRSLRDYFKRTRQHLLEVHRVMREGGVVAYAVANSFRKRKTFTLVTAFANLMRRVGFKSVRATPRQNSHRRILPAGRDISTGRFTSDNTTIEVEEMIIYGVR